MSEAPQNTPVPAFADAAERERINAAHAQNGVILIDPKATYIDAEVRIGAGTVIYPGNVLEGRTVIGANCTLLPNNRLRNTIVGDGARFESVVADEARVGAGTTVGPFAFLRPGAVLGARCRVGDFVEIKNSTVGDLTRISHLTYVGDSDLGEDINLGCGVVFVNYDGKRKYRTSVGDRAFIGCNVNLIAPVRVGSDAYVAAGSTVTDDVPDATLCIARERQVIKEGWVEERKRAEKL